MRRNVSTTLLIVALFLGAAPAASAQAPKQQWTQADNRGIRVVTDQGIEKLELGFEQVTVMRAALTGAGLKAGSKVETVLLITRDPAALGKVFPAGWLGKVDAITVKSPDFILVAVDGRARNARYSMAHELVHAILYSHYGALPWWLDEGLAEHFSVAETKDDEVRFGKLDAKGRMTNGCRITRELSQLPAVAPQGVPDQEWKSLVGSNAVLVRYLMQHVSPAELINSAGSWEAIERLAGAGPEPLRKAAERACGDASTLYAPMPRVVELARPQPIANADELLAQAQVRLPDRAREGLAYFTAHDTTTSAEMQIAIGLQILGDLEEATKRMRHACEHSDLPRCAELDKGSN